MKSTVKLSIVAKSTIALIPFLSMAFTLNAQNKPQVTNDQCVSSVIIGSGSSQTWSTDIKILPNNGFISVGNSSLNSNNMNVPGHNNSNGNSGFDGFLIYGDNTGNINWKKYFGGSANDELSSLTLMGNGDFLVVGRTSSSNGFVHGYRPGTLPAYGGTTTPSYDALAIRVNTLGDTVWSKTFGTHGDDVFNGVVKTLDNHYVLVGSTDSIGDHSKNWQAQHFVDYRGTLRASDAWIIKINSDGDTLWTNSFGGSHNDVLVKAYPTSDSGVIAVGYTESTNLSNTYGSYDALVIKFDVDGNVDWYKVIGGSALDYLHEVIQLADKSGYAIIGQTNSADLNATNFHGGGQADVWLMIMDNAGNITKSICYGGTKADFGNSIQEAPEGGFIIGGFTSSRDGDVTSMHNPTGTDQDGWILKVDTAGTIIWDRNVGSTGSNTSGGKVRMFDDGRMIGLTAVNTYTLDGDISCTPNSPATFGWIYWLSACPSYTYESVSICKGESYTFGSQNITTTGIYWDTLTMASGCDSLIKLTITVDSINTPIITASANILSTGTYSEYQWLDENNNPITGATTQTYETAVAGNYSVAVKGDNGCADTSAVYQHTPSSIHEPAIFNNLRLYPNPVNDKIAIDIPDLKGMATITINTLDGRTLVTKTVSTAHTQLSFSKLTSGIYFIKISTTDGTTVRKIVKE